MRFTLENYGIHQLGKHILLSCLLASSVQVAGQYRYGLQPQQHNAYLKAIRGNTANELVDLSAFIPGVVLDIRYATTNNFTGSKVYDEARAFARRPVALALLDAQREFNDRGLGIKIYDAYRPYRATVRFYEISHDTTYVASPYVGSRHNRGCAIDMTIINQKTGEELKMPTEYDSFTKEAWPSTPAIDMEAGENRKLLIEIMERHGFKVNTSEWWHFDFIGWKKYSVMDVSFAELDNSNKP